MAKFVEAWSKKTGKKLPHFVPENHFTHPVFKDAISKTPVKVAAGKEAGTPAKTELKEK